MNIVYVLEYLGYENGVDFEHRKSELTWLSGSPQPTEQELQDTWLLIVAQDEPELLEEDRKNALKHVNMLASRRRSDFISGGVGQELIYNEKVIQAQQFVDGGYVNPENYAFIQTEADATGETPTNVADTILLKKQQWIQVGAAIEGLRLAAKNEVRAVTDRSQFNPIFTQLVSDLNAVGS